MMGDIQDHHYRMWERQLETAQAAVFRAERNLEIHRYFGQLTLLPLLDNVIQFPVERTRQPEDAA